MSAISLHKVSNQVLRGVDLSIGHGEFFVLLGPSGAGKTSLLKVVAGLMAHQGSVRADGAEINHLPPHLRRMGYVPQDLLLFPHLTVAGNITLAMHNSPLSRPAKNARAEELAAMLKIEHLLGRRPATLSGGEKQRVALARALASEPRTLLLDEPFNNLDFRSARHLTHELAALQKSLGLTTLFVTHSLEEARALADTMAVLKDGALVEVGRPRAILDARDHHGPDFLERANHLEARACRALDSGLVEVDWAGLTLLALDRGQELSGLAVPPSRVFIDRTPPAGPRANRFTAEVLAVVKNHSAYHITLTTGGQEFIADLPEVQWRKIQLAVGDQVHCLIHIDDLTPC